MARMIYPTYFVDRKLGKLMCVESIFFVVYLGNGILGSQIEAEGEEIEKGRGEAEEDQSPEK